MPSNCDWRFYWEVFFHVRVTVRMAGLDLAGLVQSHMYVWKNIGMHSNICRSCYPIQIQCIYASNLEHKHYFLEFDTLKIMLT